MPPQALLGSSMSMTPDVPYGLRNSSGLTRCLSPVQDEGLKRLLMSWYYAGYYTGLYEGQQQKS